MSDVLPANLFYIHITNMYNIKMSIVLKQIINLFNYIKTNINIIIIIFITVVGVLLRLYLFFCNDSFTFDESALVANIIDVDFKDIFKPLDHGQVCPPLCLALFKLFHNITKGFLPYEASFRTFSLICGILVLPCFSYLLHIMSNNKYCTWIGSILLAFNWTAIIYSCTVKQYSVELFITVFLLTFFYSLDIGCTSKKNLFSIFLLISIIPFLSFVSLAIIAPGMLIWFIQSYKAKKIKQFICYIIIPSISLLIFYFIYFKNVYNAQSTFIYDYWQNINPHFLNTQNAYYKIRELFANITSIKLPILSNIYIYIRWFYLLCISGVILLIFLKKYRVIILSVFPLILTVTSCFFIYPFVERCILFVIPCILIILSFLFSKIKQTKYLTCSFIVLIAVLMFCNIPELINKPKDKFYLRALYLPLKQINPDLTNIIATKSCYTAYSGKTKILYDLDVWQQFDKNEFEKFIKSLPIGNYYIYLPYDRYKSDYNEAFLSYILSSDYIKVEKIYFANVYIPVFTAQIKKN